MTDERLPEPLQWDGEHASPLALSTYADAEERLLSEDVVAHVHGCSSCAWRLGEMALMTRSVDEALRSAQPSRPPEASHAIPWGAVAASVALSVAGFVPRLAAMPHAAASLLGKLAHVAPVLAHAAGHVAHGGLGVEWTGLALVSACLLVAGSLAVARLRPATRAL
jgi:hypothetical protein